MLKKIIKIPGQVAILLIKLYQKTLSLDHGPLRFFYQRGACRFYPTCSQYAVESISKNGLVIGGWQTLNRLRRCHPFSVGGYDPINKNNL